MVLLSVVEMWELLNNNAIILDIKGVLWSGKRSKKDAIKLIIKKLYFPSVSRYPSTEQCRLLNICFLLN